jgi:hypothetical protein
MSTMTQRNDEAESTALARIRNWLERGVLGLNLCPFARQPYEAGRVRIVLSDASTDDAVVGDLEEELHRLAKTPVDALETTLLAVPGRFDDFLDFNDFLDVADALLLGLDYDGEFQIVGFHPDFRFGDAPADDPAHVTNRSPVPIFHLLREASVERAVAELEDPDAIYRRNVERLRELGVEGWEAVLDGGNR